MTHWLIQIAAATLVALASLPVFGASAKANEPARAIPDVPDDGAAPEKPSDDDAPVPGRLASLPSLDAAKAQASPMRIPHDRTADFAGCSHRRAAAPRISVASVSEGIATQIAVHRCASPIHRHGPPPRA